VSTHIYLKALGFAARAHGDQKRKYTGEPYIQHPVAVAGLLGDMMRSKAESFYCDSLMAAALLHDTVEDTAVTVPDLRSHFGEFIASLVEEVTDVAKPEDGNRAARVAINREHVAKASYYGKAIKLADLIDNSRSIVQHDPSFAPVYLREKEALLAVLADGPQPLILLAWKTLAAGWRQLAEAK